jgi:D-alanyl-D-alanine dipeptidase
MIRAAIIAAIMLTLAPAAFAQPRNERALTFVDAASLAPGLVVEVLRRAHNFVGDRRLRNRCASDQVTALAQVCAAGSQAWLTLKVYDCYRRSGQPRFVRGRATSATK